MSQMSLLHLPPVNFRAAERKVFRGKPRFSTYVLLPGRTADSVGIRT